MKNILKTSAAVLGFLAVGIVGALVGLPTVATFVLACTVAGAVQNS